MQHKISAIFALATVTLLACSYDDESGDFATYDLYLNVDIVADGSGTSLVWANVTSYDGGCCSEVNLTDGDELVAESQGDERELIERGYGEYTAEFPIDRIGAEFRVAFLRDDQPSAKNTTVNLPARFDITAPAEGETFIAREDTIAISWDRSARDPMRITLDGTCINSFEETLTADVGRYLIHPETLEVFGGGCDVEVRVERSREGKVDGALAGGRVTAKQVRFTTIRVERDW